MYKRQHQGLSGDRTGKRPRLVPKKHLYLFLDDWKEGYSMHKIDADTLQDEDATQEQVGFPEPATLRLGARELIPTVLGSEIFIVITPSCGQTPILVYSTETGGLTMGPRLPAPLLGCFDISVAAVDRLYGLSAFPMCGEQQHTFEVLSRAPNCNKEQWSTKPRMDWSWKSMPSAPPLHEEENVTSFALHPDRHTIFMSTCDKHDLSLARGTYSFDARHCKWRWHGKWVLPFEGQGYYDSDLDAWVGLHGDGYICTCQVASRSGTSTMQPDWQISKDRLFCSKSERHLGATLTYMGDTQFCLVECGVRQDMECEWAFGDHDGCVLRLVMFSPKYNRKGELHIKIHCTTDTLVSKHLPSFRPVAF